MPARFPSVVKTLSAALAGLCCAACVANLFPRLNEPAAGRGLVAEAQTAPANAVQFPSPEVAFIVGPQVRSGTDPMAAYFDQVAARRAVHWAKELLGRDYNNRTASEGDDLTVAQNHYDLALCIYTLHYRTGDPALLDYARLVADRWWESQFIGRGSREVPGPSRPGPLYSGLAGLMLRALDGRPEMWGYVDQQARQMMNTWVVGQVRSPTLYSDLRDLGYIQLYAVLLARVLPDRFGLYDDGSDRPATSRVTDGAARRAQYLADAELAAVEYFGRLQQPDGGWRWNLWQPDPAIPAGTAIEQPFMLGIYLESVVALHQLTPKEAVKAKLASQLTRACEHLYRDTYLKSQVPGQKYKYRAVQYFYPLELNRGQLYADRHLHTSTIHAFGYAYRVTGDPKFREWGDELWSASFGPVSDGMRGLLDSPTHTKEFTMEVRSAPRYLAWRQGGTQPASAPAAGVQPPAPAATKQGPAAPELVSAALARALALAAAGGGSREETEELVNQIREAQRVFAAERDQFLSPEGVLEELEAALANARTAHAAATAGGESQEAAGRRVEWAAARLKRARDRMKVGGL